MPAPNAEPTVREENPDLEPGLFGAKLIAGEVAKHLKVHPSTVYKMAKANCRGLRSAPTGGLIVHKLRIG